MMSNPIADPVNLPVYIHFALGKGVKLAVTLSDLFGPKHDDVSPDLLDKPKAKLHHQHTTITKWWTASTRDGLAYVVNRDAGLIPNLVRARSCWWASFENALRKLLQPLCTGNPPPVKHFDIGLLEGILSTMMQHSTNPTTGDVVWRTGQTH
jgi:hypothetical protein